MTSQHFSTPPQANNSRPESLSVIEVGRRGGPSYEEPIYTSIVVNKNIEEDVLGITDYRLSSDYISNINSQGRYPSERISSSSSVSNTHNMSSAYKSPAKFQYTKSMESNIEDEPVGKKKIRQDGISLSKQEITVGYVKYQPTLDLDHNHRNEVVDLYNQNSTIHNNYSSDNLDAFNQSKDSFHSISRRNKHSEGSIPESKYLVFSLNFYWNLLIFPYFFGFSVICSYIQHILSKI
ncbi:hypothetical protein QE152_g37865 [Popillia japonica]|uniref:Uncharacterized protein n=1 Tax=Popillia japonica TaxID=7064 RepID=A0AAW1I9N5_POPJA